MSSTIATFTLKNTTGGTLTLYQTSISPGGWSTAPPQTLDASASAEVSAVVPFNAAIMYSGCNNSVTLFVNSPTEFTIVSAQDTSFGEPGNLITFGG